MQAPPLNYALTESGLVDHAIQQVLSRKMLSEPRRSRHTQTSQATLLQTFLFTSLLGSKAWASLEEATGEAGFWHSIEHVSSQGTCSPLASSLTVYNGKMKCLAAGHLSLRTQALACQWSCEAILDAGHNGLTAPFIS